jgi:TolA-binding protein
VQPNKQDKPNKPVKRDRPDEQDRLELMPMKNHVGRLSVIVGTGLFTMFVAVAAGASDRPTPGDKVIRETQEAVTATKDYTIHQKDAFQRKVQTELDEMQAHITKLRDQVNHASTEARSDIQKTITELEKKRDLAKKKAEDIHSATASSWEQVKSKTSAAMDDLRDSVNRTLSHLP